MTGAWLPRAGVDVLATRSGDDTIADELSPFIVSAANTYRLEELPARVGGMLGISEWVTIDQAKINAFAAATGDPQWIHVDAERAAAGPFGTTIAHGFLTLSLLPLLSSTAFAIVDVGTAVNYGLNRVRFPAPLPVGSRVRGRFELLACHALSSAMQLTIKATVEREGSDRPVCVAEALSRRFASTPINGPQRGRNSKETQ